jgi:hypothetical protein
LRDVKTAVSKLRYMRKKNVSGSVTAAGGNMSGEIIRFVRKKLLDNKEPITFDEAYRLALLGEEHLLDLISLSYKVTGEYNRSLSYTQVSKRGRKIWSH